MDGGPPISGYNKNRKELFKMRNKVLFTLLVIAVFILGILSVRAWDRYKVEQQARDFAAEVQRSTEQMQREQAIRDQQARDAQERERLKLECEAGVLAYENLSASQQARTERPVCDLADFE